MNHVVKPANYIINFAALSKQIISKRPRKEYLEYLNTCLKFKNFIMAISKDLILKTCIKKQEELVKNFNSRVTEMREDTYTQDHSASQTEDRTAGKVEILSTLERELAFVQMEMGYLKSLNPGKVNEKVEPGAVVVTNQRTFFIAVSTEKVEIDGQEVFGISTKAPIYAAMEGLKKSDTFSFNGVHYTIEDVY